MTSHEIFFLIWNSFWTFLAGQTLWRNKSLKRKLKYYTDKEEEADLMNAIRDNTIAIEKGYRTSVAHIDFGATAQHEHDTYPNDGTWLTKHGWFRRSSGNLYFIYKNPITEVSEIISITYYQYSDILKGLHIRVRRPSDSIINPHPFIEFNKPE